MKQKKNAGKHQTGKAGTSRRRHLPRLSAVSGLALLLSAGISEPVSALEFTFEYTYTIIANTCTLTSYGADANQGLDVSGTDNVTVNFDVNWGTVTKAQLTNENEASKKEFGLEMKCLGDIYRPTLTVTGNGNNGGASLSGGPFYVTDNSKTGAGFAIRVKKDGGAKSGNSLLSGNAVELNENADSNTRNITLEAWPTKIPDKTLNLSSGDEIKGTVTIKVSYN